VSEHTTQRLRVRATPEQCFAVVTDFADYPAWAPDIKSVTVEEQDSQGRGRR
jgi:ribosome-associated toxin RatA of RatAB toxin-antitoxin module